MNTFYILAVSLILVHEVDAAYRREWRIIPLLNRLSETVASQLFIWVHVPLVVLLIQYSFVNGGSESFRLGFSVFCVAHAFVHLAFERHPNNALTNLSSRAIIWLAALAGGASIVVGI